MFKPLPFGLLLAAVLAAQLAPPPGGGGSTGNISSSGTPASPQLAQFTDATHIKGVPQGVFNVRLIYGAVPDGSTDNSTAIANAFTASNAFTSGVPTVYFDCDTATTVCVYNFGGSGTSPINPTVATTILCAPGATLNYTGSAHAADIGATGRSSAYPERYTIQGCRWTGGASYTAGLYFNDWAMDSAIRDNQFKNFGNRTGYAIVFSGNNWQAVMTGNRWWDTDGASRNVLDAHTATNNNLLFTDNVMDCLTSIGGACSPTTVGVGLWVFTGIITNNQLKFHAPLIRVSSCATCGGGAGTFIEDNIFEGNTGQTGPAITFGDPGTTGAGVPGVWIKDNNIYWPSTSGTVTIGPESASSGSFALDNAHITGNQFTFAPTGGAAYVNTNSTNGGLLANNVKTGGVPIDTSSTPPLIPTGFVTTHAVLGVQSFLGNSGTLANAVAVFDSSGINLQRGSYHSLAGPTLCVSSTASGTAQLCDTAPKFDVSGSAIAPTAGDTIIYKTGTTNTGDLTIAINGGSAVHVRKAQGTSVLAAGDLIAGQYVPLTFDGTFWEMAPASSLVVPTSCTGLPTGALVNNASLAGFCP